MEWNRVSFKSIFITMDVSEWHKFGWKCLCACQHYFLSLSDIVNTTIDEVPVTMTTFEPTKNMSTYLLAVVVSDYTHIETVQDDILVTIGWPSRCLLNTSQSSVSHNRDKSSSENFETLAQESDVTSWLTQWSIYVTNEEHTSLTPPHGSS